MLMEKHATMARQNGVALVVALIFLLILTLLGVAAMSTTALEEKMAGNIKDQNTAFQSVESALTVAENTIGSAISVNLVVATASVTNDGLHKPGTTTPRWSDATSPNVWDTGSDYRTLTGFSGVSSPAKYIIEDLGEIVDTNGELTMPTEYRSKGKQLFRITARGPGGTPYSISMVQSTYEKRF